MKATRDNGLTSLEVSERQAAGLVNTARIKTSRSVRSIIRTNVLTRFNTLLSVLFVITLFVGDPVDGLFFVAVIINSGIGIFQELRAKRTLDSLTILTSPKIIVRRDGRESEIPSSEIVQDDLVKLSIGDQVPTDGVLTESDGLEIDESLLTGEADAVEKKSNAQVLSGSFVVAGGGWYVATAVGDASYANVLASEVKKFTKTRSELMDGTNKLLGYISLVILFVAPVLVWGQLVRSGATFDEAAIRSIAAIVGMIPEGLVVLTSFAFVLAAMTLARNKVLVQELPAVEGLARVDVICLDKTGTLTEGKIIFDRIEFEADADNEVVKNVLGAFAEAPNSPTLEAIHEAFSETNIQPESRIPFQSKLKWSALNQSSRGWVLGAPEIVFPDETTAIRQKTDVLADHGLRVLVLANGEPLTEKVLPKKLVPQAVIVLSEKVRPDAATTLEFFKKQGVAIKIISGDSPRTVAAVARQVGIDNPKPFDARNLPTNEAEFTEVLAEHTVFGRVLPEQKRMFVKALQVAGHTVAMTGDGVNDALALKDADIGIAMQSGAPATRGVAQLVLIDNKFSHMPQVLAEGRRVIANIERVANLFVIKNVYNLAFALAVTVLALSFPFLPRHLSVISWLTIGIPAFFLALAPNNQRYIPGFLPRVLKFAVPVGFVTALMALITYAFVLSSGASLMLASTTAVICVVTIGFGVLLILAQPLRAWKVSLISALATFFILALWSPNLSQFLELKAQMPYSAYGFGIGVAGSLIVWLIAKRSN